MKFDVFITFVIVLLFLTNISAQEYYHTKSWGYYTFVDKNGERAFKGKFQEAKKFNDGLAAVKNNYEWGYIDTTGNLVFDYSFNFASDFKNKIAYVKKNGEYIFINSNGEFSELKYDSVIESEDIYIISKDGLYGIVDSMGVEIEEPRFEDVGYYYKGNLAVKLGDRWGEWSDNRINFSNPDLYFRNVDKSPIFSEICSTFGTTMGKIKCSLQRMNLEFYKHAKYPEEALKTKKQGDVVVQFIIDTNGKNKDFSIIKSLSEEFDNETIRVLKQYLNQWSEPGRKDGWIVNTVYEFTVHFTL